MQRHTRPVKSPRLGIIGEEHLKARLLAMGVRPDSFRYSRKLSKDGLPWVLESAFGWLGDEAEDMRRIYSGANWSAAIKNPFRSFGATADRCCGERTTVFSPRGRPGAQVGRG